MSEWRAQLFGTFALYRERELVEVPVAISRNVLAYLLLSDGPVSREVLASELWPDSDPAESRNLISQSLWKLKRSIGEERFGELIHANSHSISIGADVETDIRSFSELMSEAERGAAGERVALMEATRLCRGELLEDVFDDWAIARQRQYRWQIIDALERLHLLFAAEGDFM